LGIQAEGLDRNQFLVVWSPAFKNPVVRLLTNLTFTSQVWGFSITPFMNSPFWSLGYECVYYALYGFFFYFRGWRRIILCGTLIALGGPQILLLLPVWWLGCWIYDAYIWLKRRGTGNWVLGAAVLWVVVGGILFIVGYKAVLLSPVTLFSTIFGLKNPIRLLGLLPRRATMFAVASGVVFSLALFPTLFAMDLFSLSGTNRWARMFRNVANGTFTIYLFHYPFLVLLLFTGLLRFQHAFRNVVVLIAMCVLMIAASFPIERFKTAIRKWLRLRIPA